MEMKRILREDGSIYLHCDPTASHYLKELMDAIFGRKQFRNEIVWCYAGGGVPKSDFPRKHDVILRYAGTDRIFNIERKPYGSHAESGRRATDLGGTRSVEYNPLGTPVNDWWADIKPLINWDKEKIGYSTQKPLALYERIIKASSNKGDIVLDPFAGCATTCIAAEKLDRQWVGIEIWDEGGRVVLDRLEKEGLIAPKRTGQKKALEQGFLFVKYIHLTSEVPERTDDGKESIPSLRTKIIVPEPKDGFSSNAARRKHLIEQYGPECQGCGRVFDDHRYLELDHNTPRSDGGLHHISNRILLCGPCNRLKSNTYTLSGRRNINRKEGRMVK